MDGDNAEERFPASGGRVVGTLALLLGVVVAVASVVDQPASWAGVALGSLIAAVGWTTFLRPAVAIVGDDLVLRGMVQTVRVPVAAVEEVAVRQLLAVRAGDRRFTSPAISRSRRVLQVEDRQRPAVGDDAAREVGRNYGLYVEERIRSRAERAREALGIRYASPEALALARDVRRSPAPLEIVWLVGSAVAFVVLLLV